eukprot:m.82370 g.82370  ORF g.82370 m.82370 type:complete len:93 (-) comp12084_c0_seq3:266-544(-)
MYLNNNFYFIFVFNLYMWFDLHFLVFLCAPLLTAMKEHKKSEPPLDTDGELSSFDNPAHNLNVLQDFDNQSRSSRTNTVSFPTEIREQDNEV